MILSLQYMRHSGRAGDDACIVFCECKIVFRAL